MSEQSTNPESKTPAGELTRYQHVVVVHDGEPTVCKVESTLPYRSGDGGQMVAVMLSPVAGGEPIGKKWPAGHPVRLATREEIEEHREIGRRAALAAALHNLGDLVSDQQLPASYARLMLVAGTPTTVEAWARAGGAAVKRQGGYATTEFKLGGLWVYAQAPQPAAETEQEWLFTFGPEHRHRGRFVRITGTKASAAARMYELFGRSWAGQHDWAAFDRLGYAELVELPESEWPTCGDQSPPAATGWLASAPADQDRDTGEVRFRRLVEPAPRTDPALCQPGDRGDAEAAGIPTPAASARGGAR